MARGGGEVQEMRRNDGLQKFLYLVMLILGIYILYKAGNILLGSAAVQGVLDGGAVQQAMEDSAMRTYAPGYTASVEGRDGSSWLGDSLQQIVPVYSYLAQGQAGQETETDIKAEATETETNATTEAIETETNAKAEATETSGTEEARETLGTAVSADLLAQLEDYNYLVSNYYTVDADTIADEQLLNADTLLTEDMTIEKNPEIPQILIYHTHSQEAFADSRDGEISDTIVGMGDVLAQELQEKYGYQVIHDTGVYDLVDGVLDRSAAYDYARAAVEEILTENPSIEVIIDLHRDGVEGQKFVTEIEGRPTSMIMFFNGISRDAQDQPISYLANPYTAQNLAFSLQLELKAREKYPGFTRNIYLKAERYNLHLRPRSLLIEAGTQLNTVEEEKNAMIPLADILNQVLEGGS